MKRNLLYGTWIVILAMTILVGACNSHQDNSTYYYIKNMYQEAHQAQDSANYSKAMELYKECVAECSSEKYEKDDSIKLLLSTSMVQLMNVYQSASMTQECIEYLDSLRREVKMKDNPHRNRVLTETFKRDVYVLLGYAMSRTDAEKEAALIMDTAMAMPMAYPTPERKLRDYTYAAAVYYCAPRCQDKALEYGRKALDEVKQSQQKSTAQWLVAIMAKLYQNKGEIGKSISMCHEGYELAEMSQDTLGMANSKKELADYLFQWKLYDEADKYATDAIQLLEGLGNSNPMVATVAYTIKAKILEQKGKKKEALTYLNKAKKTCEALPYNSGGSDVDLLTGKILVSDTRAQQAAHFNQGMGLLKKVAEKATYKIRAQAFLELAKASIAKNDKATGEQVLDSMYAILTAPTPPLILEGAYDYALSYYLKKGDKDQIMRYSNAINHQRMAEDQKGVAKNVAKSLAKFEMDKQANEMEKKMHEIENRKVLEIVGILSCLFVLAGVITIFIYKRKKMNLQHAKTKRELSNAQEQLTKTSEERDKAESQLKKIEKQEVDKVKAGVSLQQLLDMKGDKKFKDYFNKAYPYFIANLRKQIPHLTNKEELYCMLIALNCNNEELASTFNVARSSVVVAKYRIRKKLNLEEGTSMEEYLSQALQEGQESDFS